MKYDHVVKSNGVYYSVGDNVPTEETPIKNIKQDISEGSKQDIVIPEKLVSASPKATTQKKPIKQSK